MLISLEHLKLALDMIGGKRGNRWLYEIRVFMTVKIHTIYSLRSFVNVKYGECVPARFSIYLTLHTNLKFNFYQFSQSRLIVRKL
jgi:hypothetical protein